MVCRVSPAAIPTALPLVPPTAHWYCSCAVVSATEAAATRDMDTVVYPAVDAQNLM